MTKIYSGCACIYVCDTMASVVDDDDLVQVCMHHMCVCVCTHMQCANRAMASVVDDDDLAQVCTYTHTHTQT